MTHRSVVPIGLLTVALMVAGCVMPDRDEPPATEVEEVVVATPTPPPTVIVTTDSNVRAGPGIDHAAHFWLATDTGVSVTGRNADGTWLQIEHEGRPGWIFGVLTDIGAEALAALPDTTPEDMTAAEPTEPAERMPAPTAAVEPTPEPEPVEPTAPAEPEPKAPPDSTAVTVTGTVVNLRTGPGTDHPTDGQVRAGDRLQVTGRNADGSWLQVMHPVAVGEQVWIYGPLTDIDAATAQTLAEVTAVEIVIATSPEPEPTPAPVPAAEPEPAPAEPELQTPAAALPDPSGCTQWHTVNANETRLEQITSWYQLDLTLVATINGLAASEPLTTGAQLCLRTGTIDTTLAQVAEPATESAVDLEPPTPESEPAAPASVPPVSGDCPACPVLPDFPERGHPRVPIGQKVVDSPLGILWNAPGTYARDLPGLDYDFELALTDHSIMWNWSVRDFEACYDAVRIHMAEVASEINLQKLEVQLHDPIHSHGHGWRWGHREYGNWYQSPWTTGSGMDYDAWPNWNPTHPDVGLVSLDCDYSPPTGQIVCDIVPGWGNSHSIHLNAAATLALANSIAVASDNAREYRHNRLDQRIIDFNAYLFPILDNRRGDPAGQGPCLDVARAG